jgi:hypothetical protein
MLAGIVSDNNPESMQLDGYIYHLGLELVIANPDIEQPIRNRAEEMLNEE